MTIKEISILIGQLKEENKTNSKQEREFNNKWIKVLKKNIKNTLTKQN